MRTPAAALLLLAGLACGRDPAEVQVRKASRDLIRAVEEGRADRAASRLAPSFQGPDGMDRAAAGLYLAGVLRRQRVGVTVLSERLEVTDGRARQDLELLLTGREGGGLLPQDGTRRLLRLEWERRGSTWMLRRVEEFGG